MSQALFAYTLPNGTQVLIPALDTKGEILPFVLLGDKLSDHSSADANATTSVFLSEMPVTCNGLESAISIACNSDANDIQDNLGTDNLEPPFSSDVRCDGKQDIFGSAVVVNSELGELIGLQRTGNEIKDCESVIKNYVRISKTQEHVHEVEDCLNQTKNLAVGSCDTVNTDEVITFQNMLETCRTVGISIKSTIDSETQLDLDEVNGDNDVNEGSGRKDLSLKTNVNELNISEQEKVDINMSEYVDIRDKNASEELLQLANTVTNDAQSVLKQVCHNVAVCLDSEASKSGELASCTNNTILEHLEEFAEMITWFKCRLCKFAAGNKNELLEHLQTKHLEGPSDTDPGSKFGARAHRNAPQREDTVSEKLVFLCGQCSAEFSSINACKTHMMQDHELIVQESEEELSSGTGPDSNSAVAANDDSQVHVPCVDSKDFGLAQKYPSNSAAFKCSVRGCQSKFNDEKDLHMHISCHTDTENSRDFRCCECQTPFERWRTCAMHLWKVHNIDCGLLTCPVCLKYKTATSVPLENHMRIHGDVRSFTCPECGKGFKQASQLHNHRVMHLDRKTSELPKWYASKQCNICFKNYANSKCLKKHIQAVHSKLRPYVCQVCGHASARKAMLQLHYRQHTGEKPHTCPLCDYRTGDHNSLRRHIMRHTGQRPYRCPHCPYSAIQSNSYKNHLRNKHPGQSGIFSCSQCSYKTVSHEGYLLHVSDHKNGLISSSSEGTGSDVEVFPGNVAAAQLIYKCLNALSSDGNTVEANVTGSSTSADGTTQTITIQIPNQECNSENEDEVTRCFLEVQQQLQDENVDTGAVALPSVSDQNSFCHLIT